MVVWTFCVVGRFNQASFLVLKQQLLLPIQLGGEQEPGFNVWLEDILNVKLPHKFALGLFEDSLILLLFCDPNFALLFAPPVVGFDQVEELVKEESAAHINLVEELPVALNLGHDVLNVLLVGLAFVNKRVP